MESSFETKFPHPVADKCQQPSGLFGQWVNCVDSSKTLKRNEWGKNRALLLFWRGGAGIGSFFLAKKMV
jgi:hypothetical protein